MADTYMLRVFDSSGIRFAMHSNRQSRRSFLAVTGTIGLLGVAGCTSDGPPKSNESGADDADTSLPDFDELYDDAPRTRVNSGEMSHAGRMDVDAVREKLSPNNTEAENVAIAATQASKHTKFREDSPETIRYLLDEFDLDAYADERIAISGGAVTITEIYVENDPGSVQKVMVTNVPGNTDIPIQYSLVAGTEAGTGDGAVADNNLAGMWDPNNLANWMHVDYETLLNYVEHHGGRDEIEDEEWDSAWENFHNRFNTYVLGAKEGSTLAPTAAAWRHIGEQERISRENHDRAFANFKRINQELAGRDIGDDQYLEIDYTDDELGFDIVDEYAPGDIHDL